VDEQMAADLRICRIRSEVSEHLDSLHITARHGVFSRVRFGRFGSGRAAGRRIRHPAAHILASAWIVLLALLPAGCGPSDDDEAVAILRDIVAGDAPSALKARTPAPLRFTIHYEIGGRTSRADLYEPRQPLGGALVLVPGVTPEGKDDPRLVPLAATLARARFLVLVPDLEGPRQLKIGAADARDVADAIIYLDDRVAQQGHRGVGVAAISYAVGPAIIASLREDVRDKIRFFVSLGGYYDAVAMITFITTGRYRDPDRDGWTRAEPLDYAKWVFLLSNVDRLSDPADRWALSEIAHRRLDDPGAPIDGLSRALGPDGRKLFALLANRDPGRVRALIAGLPTAIRDDIRALSLRERDLTPLAGRLILIHGRADRLIPYTESRAMAAAAGDAQLFLIDGFSHVEVTAVPQSGQLQLIEAIRALLAKRWP
jgi:pimeloyl-ACP methyl ester carboxylesterase